MGYQLKPLEFRYEFGEFHSNNAVGRWRSLASVGLGHDASSHWLDPLER